MAPLGTGDRTMSTPAVTVTMCAHNCAATLKTAVESLLAQSFSDFELVIVDDASSDGTPDLLASLRDLRIRNLRNPVNLGFTRSLNIAWRAGSAPFIANQDADDFSFPHRLERQVKHLERHPDVVLLGSCAWVTDRQGDFVRFDRFPGDHDRLCSGLLTNCDVHHSSLMYRRAAMERLGGYDESFRYAQDYDLQCRMSKQGRFECLPEALIRWTAGSSSAIGVRYPQEQLELSRKIAVRNLGALKFPVDLATRFFDALHGRSEAWTPGDASRIAPLLPELFGNTGARSVWLSRLALLALDLDESGTGEGAILREGMKPFASWVSRVRIHAWMKLKRGISRHRDGFAGRCLRWLRRMGSALRRLGPC